MANAFLNTDMTGMATSNPQANVEQVQSEKNGLPALESQSANGDGQGQNAISPITIPIQIQPQVGQTQQVDVQSDSSLQVSGQVQNTTAPTPQIYQANNNHQNVVDFNQIYKGYESQFGSYQLANGVKQSSVGTTIVTPTVRSLNSVEGQYQSQYADTINGIISQMIGSLNEGFSYDPMSDNSLKVATEYAANSTLQSLAGSGVLNSSATAERVARIVSELIPQYEEKAHSRYLEYLGQLADTAQLVMSYDSQQFSYWKDAKDREFQEKEFEFEKQQKALENAWKRVDELGYVDNEASSILGVKVGTLSGAAREAKEAREFELQKMREQLELEQQNNIALAKIRSELELNNSRTLADYNANLEKSLYAYKSSVDTEKSKELSSYQANIDKDIYSYRASLDGTSGKETTTSLSTYQDIINNRWGEKDVVTGAYTITDNEAVYNYLWDEYSAGRLSQADLANLRAMYGVKVPASVSKRGNTLYISQDGKYYSMTITSGTNKEQVLKWGQKYGVDLSKYV